MRRLPLALLALAATFPLAGPVRAQSGEASPALAPPLMVSPLALQSSSISSFSDSVAQKPKKHKKHASESAPAAPEGMALGPERARILLRSLTVPGWGQATIGRRHAAGVFALAETGVWTAFTAFEIQQAMRRQTYERTARIDAGIDLSGRDDEFRRIVGAFTSSAEYNLLVVARDAANLYMQDITHPDMAGYRAYIAAHSLTGKDSWNWADYDSFVRYQHERRNAQRAALRANTALGLAIANRLVSALHAARAAGRLHAAPATPRTSWRFEVTPGDPGETVAFRAGLRARF